MMKRLGMTILAAALVVTSACSAAQKRNTAIGAGVGTAAGAVIASDPLTGALIGGVAGGAIGYGVTKD